MRNFTKAEVKAAESGSKFIDDICTLLQKEAEDGVFTGKERWKLCADFVKSVKGKAMVSALCAVFASEAKMCHMTIDEAVQEIKAIKDAPKGSITKTFSDEEYTLALTNALMKLYELDDIMGIVRAMAHAKYIEAEEGWKNDEQ